MRRRAHQRGAVFLALILIMIVVGGTFTLSALNNRQTADLVREREVYQDMVFARQMLIAYAKYTSSLYTAAPGVSPGLLPCPNQDNDPEALLPKANCDPVTEYFGRLPEYVEMPYGDQSNPPRFYLSTGYGGTGRQFWYAVSPNFLQTDTGLLPADSSQAGALSVDDEDDIVAVIIAPGEPLGLQNRRENPNDYAEYLEGGNGADLNFWTTYPENATAFNDTVLAIRRSEIRDELTYKSVAEDIQARLDIYHTACTFYPQVDRDPDCQLDVSGTYPDDATAFRAVINDSDNTMTWMKETTFDGDNWVAANVLTYDYDEVNDIATFDFTLPNSGCVRFTVSAYSIATATSTLTGSSC